MIWQEAKWTPRTNASFGEQCSLTTIMSTQLIYSAALILTRYSVQYTVLFVFGYFQNLKLNFLYIRIVTLLMWQ